MDWQETELYRSGRNLVPAEADPVELINDFDSLDDRAVIELLADNAALVKSDTKRETRIASITATADLLSEQSDQAAVRQKMIAGIEEIRLYINELRAVEHENADNPFFIALRGKST